MSEPITTDNVLEELKTKNNNLIKDLNITLKLLEMFRKCLFDFIENCKCLQNEENKPKFDLLEDYYNKVKDRTAIKDTNQCLNQRTDDLQSNSQIKSKTSHQSIGDSSQVLDQSMDVWLINTDKSNEENNERSSNEDIETKDENNQKDVNKMSTNKRRTKSSKYKRQKCLPKRFICEYCDNNKSFNNNYHLIRHIKGCHSMEKPYKCLKCDKRFSFSERLSQHVKTYHKDYEMFKCSHQNCNYQTIIEDRLTDHLARHEVIKQFECKVCHKWCLNKYELNSHKKRIHKIFDENCEKQTEYKLLSINTITESDPKGSEGNVEIDGNYYKIYVCDQSVNQSQTKSEESVRDKPILNGQELKKLLKPRKYLNKIGFSGNVFCQEIGCGKKFLSEYNLRKHMRTVHSNERPFVCEWPGCDSAFKTREGMNCHLAAHKNERNFQCDIEGCNKRFNTRQEVHQHKRSHGIKKIEKYQCSWPACGVMCQSAQALNEHINRHQNIKPFKCDFFECDKTYFTAYELRQHVMKAHDKSESFRCDYKDCAMSYLNKRDLAKHRRLHEDVAKFVCSWPDCCHTFNTSRDLSDHTNRHMDIKANKCLFLGCNRSYFKKAHLNRHIKQCHS